MDETTFLHIKHGTFRAFFIVRPHGFEPWTPEV